MKVFLLKEFLVSSDEHVVPWRMPPVWKKLKDRLISCLQTERNFPAAFYSALRNSFIPCWPSSADPQKSLTSVEARETLTVLSARLRYLNSSWQTLALDKVLFFLKAGLPLLPLFMRDSPGSPPAGQFSCLVYARGETMALPAPFPIWGSFLSKNNSAWLSYELNKVAVALRSPGHHNCLYFLFMALIASVIPKSSFTSAAHKLDDSTNAAVLSSLIHFQPEQFICRKRDSHNPLRMCLMPTTNA